MKKLILLPIFSISSLLGYEGYYAPYKAGTSQKVSQGYDGTTSHYGAGGAYALDFSGSFDVYAPKDGIVEYIGKDFYKIPFCVNNPQHWHGPANYIRVKHNDGVYSYYYHLKKVSVKKNDKVIRGKTVLGISGNTGCSTANHLHFQLAKKASMSRSNSLKISLEDIGIPLKGKYYISKNYPDTTSTSNAGIFDGAGSLVSPNENIAGGNYDYAIMHPHSPKNSTVVFQWLYDIDSCSQIDLFSYPNNLDVIVRVKAWNKHQIKEAFNVKLNMYDPSDLSNGVTLKRPDNNNKWTTLAVTSKQPISTPTHIIARCRDNSESFKDGNRVNITPELVDVTHSYYWTGTGSIISTLENRNFESAGVGMDIAVTYKSNNSFTSFQWLSSDNCYKLKIKSYNDSTDSIDEIKIKKWDTKDWKSTSCGSYLPCVISAPIVGNYYILKIKSKANAIKSGGLIAECIK
jgi:hypothetical protein